MKKIIVPVDFSLYSENALRTAAMFAKQQNAALIVVHMLELSNAIASVPNSYVQEESVYYFKIAEKKFKEFLDREYLSDVKITPIIKHYKIFAELNDLALAEEADLIIMGSLGASGFKEAFIGSNTEKVVRTSEVPVLVVKGLPVPTMFKNAVYACSFSDNDIVPYKKARKLLATLDCTLKLLYVNTPYGEFLTTRQQKEKVVQFLEKSKTTDIVMEEVVFVDDLSVEDGILEYAKEHNSDVIVMGTHGRKGLAHFFNGSISEDIANHAKKPVLTIKM